MGLRRAGEGRKRGRRDRRREIKRGNGTWSLNTVIECLRRMEIFYFIIFVNLLVSVVQISELSV